MQCKICTECCNTLNDEHYISWGSLLIFKLLGCKLNFFTSRKFKFAHFTINVELDLTELNYFHAYLNWRAVEADFRLKYLKTNTTS